MSEDDGVRVAFKVDTALYNRAKKIPRGVRSEVLRVLLEKAVEAAEKHGTMILGAIMDGSFDIVHRRK